MPYHEPDPSDPSIRFGVGLACTERDLRVMASSFADEMARTGHSVERILAVFREPFYAGAHLAWRSLGEAEIRRIAREAVSVFGALRVRVVEREAGTESARGLPVLGETPRRRA